MKIKYLLFSVLVCMVFAGVYAASTISRTGQNSMLNIGGTTTTNGKSAIVSGDTNTNQYEWVTSTATVAGAATAATNSFTTAFLAAPVAVRGMPSGLNGTQSTNFLYTTVIVTTSNLVVTGLSTNASTGVNAVPVMLYGYKTTGKFE